MKYLSYILSVTWVITMLNCCEDSQHQPLIIDNVSPNPVFNVEVENRPGGAIITYDLPSDNDILYIEAQFIGEDLKINRWKSSIYNNSIELEGFPDTIIYLIDLYVVDQSENRSEKVVVQIKPTTIPIHLIAETIEINPDFGGINLTWFNSERENIALVIEAENNIGELVEIETLYTSVREGNYAVRGFDTIPRIFSVFVRDRYDNISWKIIDTIKPLFEQELDRNLMKGIVLAHDSPFAYGWQINNIFDGKITEPGFHTGPGWIDPDPTSEYPYPGKHFVTIDLGVTAKLSRFKFWQRQSELWLYTFANPRFFDLWGTPVFNPDGSFTGWTKLIDNGEVIKPSGLPDRQLSNEDIEAGARGHEFLLSSEAPPVRYIRFVNLENWSGTDYMHIMEVAFWGEIIK